MSATMSPSLNGRVKKSLAFQLDRLDTILDGLAEALNGAVADAVKANVGQAAREAVQVALEESLYQSQAQSQRPIGFWQMVKAKVAGAFNAMKSYLSAGYRCIQKFGSRSLSAAALALQAGLATVHSNSMRVGMLLGAVASCILSLMRKDVRQVWWGAGILMCTLLIDGFFGSLGTLFFGGGVLSLLMLQTAFNQRPLESA